MTRQSSRHEELRALLEALCDESITSGQKARVEELLLGDPEAEIYYIHYMQMQAEILREFGGAVPVSGAGRPEPVLCIEDKATEPAADRPGSPDPRQVRRPRSRRPWMAWTIAAVACLVALLALGRPISIPPGGGRQAPRSMTVANRSAERREAGEGTTSKGGRRSVAVLTRMVDVRWGPTTLPTELGSALPTGRLRLISGLIQLEFYRGAVVVLEGPADFELLGTDRAFCRQGKLRVRAANQSSKFSVETPNANVIDLGTEFGIRVDEQGGSEVQVFEGSVELHGKDPGRASLSGRQLMVGQGMSIDVAGAARATRADPGSFVGAKEIELRSSNESGHRYRAWLDLSRMLRADPRVLVYYSFEGQANWERSLHNQVTGRPQGMDGAIVGSQWAEGRWPGKGALEFKRASDRVRVNIPGEFAAMTLMAWVRIDGFDRKLNSLLLADGWDVSGEVHWELNAEGAVIFALKSRARCDTPAVLGYGQLGIWTQLATVLDAPNESITTYVNGRAIKDAGCPSDVRAKIGWADIGNWSNPDPKDVAATPIRNLNGRIDEFVLFDQALTAQEIAAIYEVGRPGP
jgi:Concanavalin A-like lectin/glucanases superfamily/FecR protein